MSEVSQRWRIELDADDATAYAVLAADKRWNGYSIGDLVPPYRAYAQVAVAGRAEQTPSAACLLLRHPAFTALIPSGDPDAVAAILRAADLPQRTFVAAQAEHLPALAPHYTFVEGQKTMLRMAVTAATFRPPAGYEAVAVRLGPTDLASVRALYGEPEGRLVAPFHDDLLTLGPLYGVRVGDALVAAGGTHALAARYGIAAIGNILTRSAYLSLLSLLLQLPPIRDLLLDHTKSERTVEREGTRCIPPGFELEGRRPLRKKPVNCRE